MISLCIPAYHMMGRGVEMLIDLLDSIRAQSFKDYEIVVSDARFTPLMALGVGEGGDARWVTGREGAAANLNNAIDHARGDIIKPMFQDDKFMEPDSLQKIQSAFDSGAQWLACTSHNDGENGFRKDTHVPYPHKGIEALRQGENTYGSPSAMAWRKNDLRFDEKLHWLFDCEFYARMAEHYGVPTFVDTPIFIRQWSGMATLTVATGEQRIADTNYVIEKYR